MTMINAPNSSSSNTLRRRRGAPTPPASTFVSTASSSDRHNHSDSADKSAGIVADDHDVSFLRRANSSVSSLDVPRLDHDSAMPPISPSISRPLPAAAATTSPATVNRAPSKKSPTDESRLRKMVTRLVSGLIMLSLFILILLSGHVYVCALVALLQVLLFRELVTVRYHAFFDRIEQTIPLFRTTQWMWFFVAIFYAYSEFVVEVIIKSNTKLHYLLGYAQWAPMLSFSLYTGTFVLTIATMQTGHIKFQLNQLCWTVLVLCLTVGQLKYIMHNIYNGLIWFTLPILLVITNDVMAYFSGITMGRKFITRPFMPLSPNKTWEGFIGGGIFTIIIGWYLSRYLAQFTWMTCPTNQLVFFPQKLECEVENIFHEATTYFPHQVFELLPRAVVHLLPLDIVEICTHRDPSTDVTTTAAASIAPNLLHPRELASRLAPCVSGSPHQRHHHYQLALTIIPIQLHAISLSLFASLVAPFGGFLASAIKRAYNMKDFDSLIPGHGGVMDRFDCQMIMALCTWVHYNTFVKTTTVSVAKMLYMYRLLGEEERREFLERISGMVEGG
mmetsp:Transcript_17420/g.36233  ORF Transcript_17420/g.36233 Transcript_17420/m.36233 type:complete len:559 (+) Transcript_17420:70-1746(+)